MEAQQALDIRTKMLGSEHPDTQLAQQALDICSDSVAVQELADILARANVVPVAKRLEIARALYDADISNEHILRDRLSFAPKFCMQLRP